MKKWIAMLMALILLRMPAMAIPSDWAKDGIEKATRMGFVPVSFAEDWQKEIKREEFAELAVRFLSAKIGYTLPDLYAYIENQSRKVNAHTSETTIFWKVKEGSMTFSDTNRRLIRMAADIGIIEGKGDGIFDSHKSITRQEAAVMLLRTYAAYSNSVSFQAELSYADTDNIADWASLGVRFATKSGIMQGVGENTFAPLGAYTREQAVLTFIRLWNLETWEESPGLYRRGEWFSKPETDISVAKQLLAYRTDGEEYTTLGKWETPYGIVLYDVYTYPETGKKEYAFLYFMNDWNSFHILQPYWEMFGTGNVLIDNIRFSDDMQEMTCSVSVENQGVYTFKTDLFLGETIRTGYTKK